MSHVDVVVARLDELDTSDAAVIPVLSIDELTRAARFAQPLHRRRYLAAHLFLRSVVAERLDRPPGSLALGRGPRGKPRLDGTAGLMFNLSHSGDMAVCALADREVGIDLEVDQPVGDADAIAARILEPAALAHWQRFTEPERSRALLREWTRYEALAKAQGGGLVEPPPRRTAAAPQQWELIDGAGGRWSVCTLERESVPGCIVSLAILGEPAPVSVRAWHVPRESATLREP